MIRSRIAHRLAVPALVAGGLATPAAPAAAATCCIACQLFSDTAAVTQQRPKPFASGRTGGRSRRGVLAAPIAVKDHPRDVTATGDRGHVERGDDQAGVVLLAHRVAEDAPGVQVDHGGQVELPSPVRISVMSPYQATSGAGTVSTRLTRSGAAGRIPGRVSPAPATRDPGDQAEFGHQHGDRVVRDLPTLIAQLVTDAGGCRRCRPSRRQRLRRIRRPRRTNGWVGRRSRPRR
jgi:hypothetical protein